MKRESRRAFRRSAGALTALAAAAFLVVACAEEKRPPLTVLEIQSGRCEPCEKMGPVIDELKAEYGKSYRFTTVNAASQEGIMYVRRYQVRVVPTQLVVDDLGMALYRHEGIITKEEFAAALNRLSKARR